MVRPKLRGTTEAFASALFGRGVTKSSALESSVIAGFVRGLSVRDVENTLADSLGAEAALSKSTVLTIGAITPSGNGGNGGNAGLFGRGGTGGIPDGTNGTTGL